MENINIKEMTVDEILSKMVISFLNHYPELIKSEGDITNNALIKAVNCGLSYCGLDFTSYGDMILSACDNWGNERFLRYTEDSFGAPLASNIEEVTPVSTVITEFIKVK